MLKIFDDDISIYSPSRLFLYMRMPNTYYGTRKNKQFVKALYIMMKYRVCRYLR
jgi:hypothetical protein